MKKRAQIIVGFGILLATIAAVYSGWPLSPLVWCTTKPLTNGTDIVRVRLLVPRDYDQANVFEFSGPGQGLYGMNPAEQYPFLPISIRRALRLEPMFRESGIVFTVMKRGAGRQYDSSVHLLRSASSLNRGTDYRAGRWVGDDVGVWIIFASPDKQDFDTNRDRILMSAKVLPYEVPESTRF